MRRLRQSRRSTIFLNKMDKRPILFIDSGFGGIPYAHFFRSRNKTEKLIYAADRANFPYGPRSKEEVIKIVLSFAQELIDHYDPKIIVVACNTASVSALLALRETFPTVPVVGTVPAIKSAVLASRKRRIGVLGTQRTIEDPYIAELAFQYGPDCEIFGEAAAELVDFVERRWFEAGSEERLLAVKPWIEKLRRKGADTLVLACTHFLLLADEFRIAAGNDLLVFDSVEGVCKRVESILDSEGLHADLQNDAGAPVLIVTGDEPLETRWEKLAGVFGFTMETRR